VLLIVFFIDRVIELYILLIFVWALGSWFPAWRYQGWFKLVNEFVWPYLSLFKSLPLASAGLDFTPTVAIIVLWMFRRLVDMAAVGR
jgi:YggT family protein